MTSFVAVSEINTIRKGLIVGNGQNDDCHLISKLEKTWIFFFSAIKADNDIQWEPAFRMYRGLFLFILELFLFGINLYGWKSVGINPAHICDLKNRLCPLRVLEVRSVTGLQKTVENS